MKLDLTKKKIIFQPPVLDPDTFAVRLGFHEPGKTKPLELTLTCEQFDAMKKAYWLDRTELRKIQLVAREGVLTQIMEEWDFPTENHRKVFDLLYAEVVKEMTEIGLVPV